MELKHIKELMAVMQRTGTKRLVIKKEGVEVELEREENPSQRTLEPAVSLMDENPLKHEIALHRANLLLSRGGDLQTPVNNNLNVAEAPAKKVEPTAPGTFVTSPMVGTFYLSPAPDEPTFVKVGDRVEKDTVVCIIEAMKVMNEVKAGVSGIVTEVLVETGHPVEFATKLFRIT